MFRFAGAFTPCLLGTLWVSVAAATEVELPAALLGDSAGALVAVDKTGEASAETLGTMLGQVGFGEPVPITHDVTYYRVQYRTPNYNHELVVASGLVAIPQDHQVESAVAYFHGTTLERSGAPSQPGPGEGFFVGGAVAGTGHVFVAPDYIGLGTSREVHPYMVRGVTVSTGIDLLRAGRDFLEHLLGSWPDDVYLTGFSQGGHTTLAVQQALEELDDRNFVVRASAPIAGPFHLFEIAFPQALTGETDSHPFYLCYVSRAYSHVYGEPLGSVLKQPYADKVAALLDGEHGSDAIRPFLPEDPRELFVLEVLSAYDAGESHWFLDRIRENALELDHWKPAAPIRIYYGDNDVDVLPEEALRAAKTLRANGGDVTAISVGAYGHETSALHALPKAINWFTELAGPKN